MQDNPIRDDLNINSEQDVLQEDEKELKILGWKYREVLLKTPMGREVLQDMVLRSGMFSVIRDPKMLEVRNFMLNTLGIMGILNDKNMPRVVADWARLPAELPGGIK